MAAFVGRIQRAGLVVDKSFPRTNRLLLSKYARDSGRLNSDAREQNVFCVVTELLVPAKIHSNKYERPLDNGRRNQHAVSYEEARPGPSQLEYLLILDQGTVVYIG